MRGGAESLRTDLALSAALSAEVLREAGVPPGVSIIVQREGPVVGAALSRHLDVAMLSFTGSHRARTSVAVESAPGVKRVALELVGKSPNLIFADADLEEVVAGGGRSVASDTGQNCDAPTRMLVDRSALREAVEIARRTAVSIVVVDPKQDGDHIEPLAHDVRVAKVQKMIAAGAAEGATPIAGGPGRPDGLREGIVVRPTIFADVTPQMMIVREEIFGPVLVLIPFRDEENAVAQTNDTNYRLSSHSSSGDPDRISRVARRPRAGNVNVDGSFIAPGRPFGGYKHSGLGREGGSDGLSEFLETKVITKF